MMSQGQNFFQCPQCGGAVAYDASSCPQCGYNPRSAASGPPPAPGYPPLPSWGAPPPQQGPMPGGPQPTAWPQPPAGAPGGGWAQQTQVGPAPGLAFGGFWIRVLAYIIDAIILGIIRTVLVSAAGESAGLGISGLVGIVYFVGLWGTTGQTIGMMPFNLRVVSNTDGGKITWASSILRFVGLIVAFLVIFIGVIWVAFDSRKRGWHDMIGGTVVVKKVG